MTLSTSPRTSRRGRGRPVEPSRCTSPTPVEAFACLALLAGCGDAAGPVEETGSLDVSVVVDGWALPRVDVHASGPQGAFTASTGEDGVALFPALPVGTYTIALDGVDPDARLEPASSAVVELEERAEVVIPGSFDPGRFVDVRLGETFRCALNENGNAYCWGFGSNGELGNGSANPSGRPVRVRSPARLRAIAAGAIHVCGLGVGGTAYCWGSNASGRLGRGLSAGELQRSSTPARVEGGTRFSGIEASEAASCGVEIGSGRVHCWGSAEWGVLGSPGPSADLPRPVASLEAFGYVTGNDAWSGDESMAGLTTDGRVFFWGAVRPDGGPSWMSFADSEPSEIPLPLRARAVTPACAVLTDDRVMCWPDLEREVPPEVRERLVPTSVAGLHEYLVQGIDDAFFRAGLPCSREAQGYVCLQDWFVELPPLDFGGETAVAVASRGYGGCAVTDAGRVWCWNALDFDPELEAGPGS